MTTTKRIISAILCCLLLVGLFPTTAFAYTAQTGTPYFDFSYESDGTEIMYHDSFSLGGYTAGDASGTSHRVRIWMNGEEAYCIEPGHHLVLGDQLTLNASEMWNGLSPEVQNAVKTVLAFGRAGNSANIGGSDGSQTVATQLLIWEFVCGARNPVTFERYTDAILNSICKDGWHPEVRQVYDTIVSYMTHYRTMPSFADGSTKSMSYADGKYSLTLTDSNGVLSDCGVSASNSNVQITKSGNTLTLTASDYISGGVTVTLTKSSSISASAQLVTYGDPNLQDVIVGIAKPDDVTASFKVTTPGGNLDIQKTSEDGAVEGISVTVSGNGVNETIKTGSDGTAELKGLLPGTYTVTEQPADYYEPQEPKQITISAGNTVKVGFENKLKKGSVSVVKNSEDNLNEGVVFRLYGQSASGQSINLRAETDSTGAALFSGVPISGAAGYTLEEINVPVRYVIPAVENVQVFWEQTTELVMTNTLKKFMVSINKADAETDTAQGDASLAGASYGLYNGETLVETLVTDSNGCATSDYYPCGDEWTLREISPPEGYLLDENIYPVGASPENYTVELNSAPDVNVSDTVIKGQISIIKHRDNGETQIETPEQDAEFQIYLACAGSYESAKDSEKDTLVCDQYGFASSKALPYGTYTVHQAKGYPDTELMPDFTVYIAEDGRNYKYLINNAPYEAYIKVIKADSETKQQIPLSGAGFEIYDADGNKVEMKCTYPKLTSIDTFYVSEDGSLITPEVLPAGDYTLVEVLSPRGYVLDSTPIPFTVTAEENVTEGDINTISVTVYNKPQKGTICITKSGEVFSSVKVTGEEAPADKDGTTTTLKNAVYTPIYEVKGLAGAKYRIIAAEDIVTGDGTVRAKAGAVVDELTTDTDGKAVSKELYLGKYSIEEISAPEGYALNAEPQEIELSYAGQEVYITTLEAAFFDERQKLNLTAEKEIEISEKYGIGVSGELAAVSFGLYAAEEITAADGGSIPKDGLIEIAFADTNGHVQFDADLPFGSYYAKELSCDPHYAIDDSVYTVEFNYSGQEQACVSVALNDGQPILNSLLTGRIEGKKADTEDKALAGATFGLFKSGVESFTDENAIAIAKSDENGGFAFEDVPLGDYVVVELEAPAGYELSDARHYVSLTYDEQVIGLKIINDPIAGGVELTKVDKDYPDNHLSGAEFVLYADSDGNGSFDESIDAVVSSIPEVNDGVYRLTDLPFGSYFVKEKTPPVGFLPDENVYLVTISEQGELVKVENIPGKCFADSPITGEVTVYKTDADGNKLVGAGFRIYDENKNIVAEGVTGEDGKVSFTLRYGKYSAAEYKAPDGYVLDETPVAFEIKEQGQKLSFDMENLKIKGKLVITKVDAEKEQPLSGAKFRVYDAGGKVVGEQTTGKDGTASFELEFGKYVCQEIEAPKGYALDSAKLEFSISENGKAVTAVMTNKTLSSPTPAPSASVPKTGDESNIDLWGGIALATMLGGTATMSLAMRKKNKDKYNCNRKKGNANEKEKQ